MNNPGILRVWTRTKMRKTIAIILSVAALGLNGWAENIAPDLQSTVDELKDKLAKLEAKLAEFDEAKTAPASKPDPAVVVIPQDRVDFAKSVQGIFEARCIDCHGSKKQKGDLRLDKKETALAEVIQPGNSGESELAKLISLPADHEDIMPNKGEPLTKDQIATIKQWIDEGANWPDGLVLVSAKDRAAAKAAANKLPEPEIKDPAVPIRKSITPDYLICLEDGRKFKSLKRHLRTKYDMSPEEYRAKWGLAKDYPMVAPNYAKARSELAKQMGLGQGGRKPARTTARAKK